jgi:hypothetical protein
MDPPNFLHFQSVMRRAQFVLSFYPSSRESRCLGRSDSFLEYTHIYGSTYVSICPRRAGTSFLGNLVRLDGSPAAQVPRDCLFETG